MPETTVPPPVPVLTGAPIPATRKLRPKALLWLTLLQVGCNIIGRFMPHTPTKSPGRYVFLLLISAAIEITTFVGFWKGRNWGRILILLGCGLEFIALIAIRRVAPPTQVYSIVHALFLGYVVYWLTRKPAVAFFKAPGAATSKPGDIAPNRAGLSL